MRQLSECRLYGILDLSYVDILDVGRVARAMAEGGVDIVQLRAKQHSIGAIGQLVKSLHPITQMAGIPLIVNDHPEIVRDGAAEGVHVGQDDLPVGPARTLMQRKCILGKSTHSLEQAFAAKEEGADYIGFGPLFATPTKPDYPPIGLDGIGQVHETLQIPIFCIGGIKLDNLERVIAAGAQRVVIVSGLLQSENIEAYAKAAKQMLLKAPSSTASRKSQI